MKNKKGFARRGTLWIKNKVKGTDRFALPVSLNFNGESSFKTTIGGTISVVFILWLLGYSILLWKEMINRESSVINSITKIDNLIYKPDKYNLKDYSFAFGIYATGLYYNYISDPTYFTLEVKQKTATK